MSDEELKAMNVIMSRIEEGKAVVLLFETMTAVSKSLSISRDLRTT